MLIHSEKCLKEQQEYRDKIENFKKTWPDYCKKCGGYGIASWYESAPYGSASAQMPMSEYCEYCVGSNKCSRCGEGLTDSDEALDEMLMERVYCKICNWHDGSKERQGDGFALPYKSDDYCECEIEKELEDERAAQEYWNQAYGTPSKESFDFGKFRYR